MTGFNHTLGGTILAVIAPAPFQPLLALLSHFLLDSLPHFGNHDGFKLYSRNFILLIIFDAVLCSTALAFSIILFPDKWLLMAACAAAATLPDFLWALRPYTFGWMKHFYEFHDGIQWGERPHGWIYELAFTILAIAALFYLAR